MRLLEGGPNGSSTPFFRLFYQVESLKSGMHHPDGIPGCEFQEAAERGSRESVASRCAAHRFSQCSDRETDYIPEEFCRSARPPGRCRVVHRL